MSVDQLPGTIVTKTRDKVIDDWKRDFQSRVPGADVGDASPADTDARVMADMLMPLYSTTKVSGDNTVLEQSRGKAVDQWAEREGVPPRREAIGASGSVSIKASPGGGALQGGEDGDELRHEQSGSRYRVIITDHYNNGDSCGIVGKDTGPATNLPAGTQLKWTSPPAGIADTVTVIGNGLTGGAERENDDKFKLRIKQEKQSRAASGNDSEYQQAAEGTPDVAIQKAFTYPAVTAAGVICLLVTVVPAHPGGSRVANSSQVSLIETHLADTFPADDGLLMAPLAEEPADVTYSIRWAEGAAGWADRVQWPPFYAVDPVAGPGAVRVTSATNATVFTLATANGVYSGVRQPRVGQTIGFYDTAGFAFRRKRILSFTGTGPWSITCDTTNNASDTGYTPQLGQRVMPWSDSLDSILFTEAEEEDGLPSGVLAYFDTLGPGEQVATFYDEGRRQRRSPAPPKFWPYELTTRGLIDAVTANEVQDVDVLEGDGIKPSVGVPGVYSNILLLRYLAVFPET